METGITISNVVDFANISDDYPHDDDNGDDSTIQTVCSRLLEDETDDVVETVSEEKK